MPRSSSSHDQAGSSRKRSGSSNIEYSFYSVPSNDSNSWYYPSNEADSEVSDLDVSNTKGNWGNKHLKNARWVRKGKMVAWGPGMEDWKAEARARTRMRQLLPQSVRPPRSPSPPSLPHLRSPSPPLSGPYPPPAPQYLNYTSFVLDKSITHTFRSRLVDDLERSTNSFIEAEAAMKQALGRLWQAMNEDPDRPPLSFAPSPGPGAADGVIPKQEEDDDMAGPDEDEDDEFEREQARRMARAPDLTPAWCKLFLDYDPRAPPPPPPAADPMAGDGADARARPASPPAPPLEVQTEQLKAGLIALREMQDDGREYVERLEEIRDGLGDVRAKRDAVWHVVRSEALEELKEAARNMDA